MSPNTPLTFDPALHGSHPRRRRVRRRRPRHAGPTGKSRVAHAILDTLVGCLLLAVAWFFLAGCATRPFHDPVFGADYQPGNIHLAAPNLPAHIKRVAFLPLVVPGTDGVSEAGREALEPVLRNELLKAGGFEVAAVDPRQLEQWTGRPGWTGEEKLPLDFFLKLREITGADAVLFSQLTVYRPYPPLMVGWRLKLVDTRESRIWWAADEAFNAGEPLVVNAARRYYKSHLADASLLGDSQTILQSPRKFGQYTAHALFQTLPLR